MVKWESQVALMLSVAAVMKAPMEVAAGGLRSGGEIGAIGTAAVGVCLILPLVAWGFGRQSRAAWMSAAALQLLAAYLSASGVSREPWQMPDPAATRSAAVGAVLYGVAGVACLLAAMRAHRRA